MPLIVIILLLSSKSFAFLDFMGEQARRAVEAAAYVDAVAELSTEIIPSGELQVGASDIKARADKLRSEANQLMYLSQTSKDVLHGPDWSSQRLDINIKATTDYIRRFKKLIVRVATLGNEGATALNTTETNIALNEVQKNQQAQLLQNEDAKLRLLEKEHEESRQWQTFANHQRIIRNPEAKNGILR